MIVDMQANLFQLCVLLNMLMYDLLFAHRKSASPEVKDLMFEFFSYVNSPATSVDDIVMPSWLDDWRYSQLADYERNYGKSVHFVLRPY